MIIDIKEYAKKPIIVGCSYDGPHIEIPKRFLDYLIDEFESKNNALIEIEEYWNRDQNENAMADALWKIIEIADGAMTEATKEFVGVTEVENE